MKIKIREIIKLFDEKAPGNKGHVSAIMSMFGEDIAACAFESYMGKNVDECSERKFQATGFKNGSGPRLDRWFYDKKKKVLYQCEIKNWCAWGTTGRSLKIDAKQREVQMVANYYWDEPLKEEFKDKGRKRKINKVLIEMNPPGKKYAKTKIKPLLILWFPVSTGGGIPPFFKVKASTLGVRPRPRFNYLYVFSISLYLRQLHKSGEKWLVIKKDDSKKRISLLKEIGALK